ncbi:MAG: anhydro-N-acetylmuramic acid kinase [Rhodospirillaceae bacterium]|nr:anhydro-N-acetylmuramic acid kinase [Rhodospirillaceae bacterium]MBT5191410.1 anhydro-N-acetylmuramic acid kinase [Rhodospirillaceae bacterium]MBT5897305.1 anhydro-N-acetylmuramic acid kinase [Rhodospirillaceae bacterium]MBT7759276.1 anhydro-N-acetylmuramic acid kinase [Rhodospirillaceae bacterium]
MNLKNGHRTAIGLMSGTSMDGIDAALLSVDEKGHMHQGATLTQPYDGETKARIRAILGGRGGEAEIATVSELLTRAHADIVNNLVQQNNINNYDISIIGFHGHTILHQPEVRRTRQIGDGALLAALTGIDVVDDFRSADVAAGGQGAPLASLYHGALAAGLPKPLAVLNVGGVANVTWIGKPSGDGEEMLAFDTGPGNALIDDWVRQCGRGEMDLQGHLALAGEVDEGGLAALLNNVYFDLAPPKSLDRNDFTVPPKPGWSPEDGAATLTAFTARSVAKAMEHLPSPPERWLVCGGGRHNPALMTALGAALSAPVAPVETVGWRGDFLEAEAFAYLALRHLDGLPLSLPGTTGVPRPMTGGRLNRHAA